MMMPMVGEECERWRRGRELNGRWDRDGNGPVIFEPRTRQNRSVMFGRIAWGPVADDCQSGCFLPDRISELPQGEPCVQQVTGRPGTMVDVHTGRGRPRSPPWQGGTATTAPWQGGTAEIRNYTLRMAKLLATLTIEAWTIKIRTCGGPPHSKSGSECPQMM
jgi:hypothetical protein